MKILQINKFYYLRGGAERYFFEIQKILGERGHEVIPFSMHDGRNRQSPYSRFFMSHIDYGQPMSIGTRFKAVPRVVFSMEAKRKIEALIDEVQPDIAHLHNIAHHISPSILYPLQRHTIPVVQTLHDYKLICPTYRLLAKGKICERCRVHRYYNAILQRCNKGLLSASILNCLEMYVHKVMGLYEKIDVFISPSRFLKEKFVDHGVAEDRIVHLPNFLRMDNLTPQYTSHNGYILYFGRVSEEKGLLTLVQAMRAIPEVQLRIAGEGPLTEHLKNCIERERIKNIFLMGYVQGVALIKTIRDSMFTVLPSEWYENYPFSILESFVLGKPVVGSRIGGIPELIQHKKTGLTFEAGNVEDLRSKLRELVTNPGLIREMGIRARHASEDILNADMHYEKLMIIYRRAARKRESV